MKHNVIIFEGCDMTGKTTIARELSKRTGVPYFKHSAEHGLFRSSAKTDHFMLSLQYGATMFVDFLQQTKATAIVDRFIGSEFVYHEIFARSTDWNVLNDLDKKLSAMGAVQILCRRKNYTKADDQYPGIITLEKIKEIDALFEEYANDFTRIKTLELFVDDENLDREIDEIMQFIER